MKGKLTADNSRAYVISPLFRFAQEIKVSVRSTDKIYK